VSQSFKGADSRIRKPTNGFARRIEMISIENA
jgi:hypothetical protein